MKTVSHWDRKNQCKSESTFHFHSIRSTRRRHAIRPNRIWCIYLWFSLSIFADSSVWNCFDRLWQRYHTRMNWINIVFLQHFSFSFFIVKKKESKIVEKSFSSCQIAPSINEWITPMDNHFENQCLRRQKTVRVRRILFIYLNFNRIAWMSCLFNSCLFWWRERMNVLFVNDWTVDLSVDQSNKRKDQTHIWPIETRNITGEKIFVSILINYRSFILIEQIDTNSKGFISRWPLLTFIIQVLQQTI